MRLRTKVHRVTGATRHYFGRIEDDELIKTAEIPPPSFVEIQAADAGYYLFYLDENDRCIADTWHETLSDAKYQARHEFEIGERDWEERPV